MATYRWEFGAEDRFGVECDELFRDGELVGGMRYNDITDTCQWWYTGPGDVGCFNAWADAGMSPADFKAIVMEAYGDGKEAR